MLCCSRASAFAPPALADDAGAARNDIGSYAPGDPGTGAARNDIGGVPNKAPSAPTPTADESFLTEPAFLGGMAGLVLVAGAAGVVARRRYLVAHHPA